MQGYTEEGVLISPYTHEITAYLQDCFELLEAGEEDRIMSNPFYTPAHGALSDEKIDKFIKALDEEYSHELGVYASYHRNRSGAEAAPDWHRLSPRARRAVAEGCIAIIERHNPTSTEEQPK